MPSGSVASTCVPTVWRPRRQGRDPAAPATTLDVASDLPGRKEFRTVSNMESNSDRAPQHEANDALDSLTVDRERLVERLKVPWALMAAFGALGAWWVGAAASTQPGRAYEPPVTGWMALLGVFVVAHLVRRETGVRFRTMGAPRHLGGHRDPRHMPGTVQRLVGTGVDGPAMGRRDHQRGGVRHHDRPGRDRLSVRGEESQS